MKMPPADAAQAAFIVAVIGGSFVWVVVRFWPFLRNPHS